jgi:hypothetical protein
MKAKKEAVIIAFPKSRFPEFYGCPVILNPTKIQLIPRPSF